MGTMIERHASRIVLVDTTGRALLFRYRAHDPFWIVPGGGLEAGEDHLAAAAREIREETGQHVPTGAAAGHLVRTFRRRDGRWFDPDADLAARYGSPPGPPAG